jgi:ABC-2 type transport system ATP-binding protein
MIEVEGLTKYYGNKLGVLEIGFKIGKGEAVGLLGPNGAGKTTIMKMLAGHMLPTAGSIRVDGIDAIENPKEAARRIGFLPEVPPLYPDMEVKGFLNFIAEIKGVPAKARAAQVAEIMDQVAITQVKSRLIKNLSKGYRQRVGLAQALIGFPPVLILDPKQITEIRSLMEKLAQERTVILSTHILSEIKIICSRVLIINGGRLMLDDTVENLEEGGKSFSIQVKGSQTRVEQILRAVQGVSAVKFMNGHGHGSSDVCRFIVEGRADQSVREEVFRRLAAEDLPILEMRSMGNSIEEIFLEVTA